MVERIERRLARPAHPCSQEEKDILNPSHQMPELSS